MFYFEVPATRKEEIKAEEGHGVGKRMELTFINNVQISAFCPIASVTLEHSLAEASEQEHPLSPLQEASAGTSSSEYQLVVIDDVTDICVNRLDSAEHSKLPDRLDCLTLASVLVSFCH